MILLFRLFVVTDSTSPGVGVSDRIVSCFLSLSEVDQKATQTQRYLMRTKIYSLKRSRHLVRIKLVRTKHRCSDVIRSFCGVSHGSRPSSVLKNGEAVACDGDKETVGIRKWTMETSWKLNKLSNARTVQVIAERNSPEELQRVR